MSADLQLCHLDKDVAPIIKVLKNNKEDNCEYITMHSLGINSLVEKIGMWWLDIFTDEEQPDSWVIFDIDWIKALEKVRTALIELDKAKDKFESQDIYKYHEHNFLCIETIIEFVLTQNDKEKYFIKIN